MIYLDHNATTPCAPEVLDAMMPYFSEKFGNASSQTYTLGWQADEAVRQAREQVATFLDIRPEELIFTSGATEALNLAIQGTVSLFQDARPGQPLHIITVATEHSAIMHTYHALERKGIRCSIIGVDKHGLIDWEQLEQALCEETVMLAVMLANNETGVVQDITKLAEWSKEHRLVFLTDTTQAIGKMSVNLNQEGLSFACLSAHKMYGPKGVGALYVSSRKPRARLNPMIFGGTQQTLRSGTLNVPGIVGLGAACALAQDKMSEWKKIEQLRDDFEQVMKTIEGLQVHSASAPRLPNVSNIAVPGMLAKELIAKLHHQVAVSLGSACHAGSNKPSHVLQAMQVQEDLLYSSIRVSLGRDTTAQEMKKATEILKTNIESIRKKILP